MGGAQNASLPNTRVGVVAFATAATVFPHALSCRQCAYPINWITNILSIYRKTVVVDLSWRSWYCRSPARLRQQWRQQSRQQLANVQVDLLSKQSQSQHCLSASNSYMCMLHPRVD
jgi:hypothetical protein